MRYWPTLLITAVLFSACSKESAFTYFTKLDSRHERAVSNLKRATLTDEANRTAALISILHLNPVDPQLYGKRPSFLVALFDRGGRTLEEYNITLNGKTPVGLAQLDENCSLRELMPQNNPWNRYYQLLFRPTKEANLTLFFGTGPFLKGEVTFHTDQ
ncbi:MAG: hypothetical protein IE886_05210 [Campylobacterales bacterium]|nr:hypothetical protein [Campylobacterales bacterium]